MATGSHHHFLAQGKAAASILALDWRATPVGPVSHWSDSLRSIVGTMTRSHQPMLLLLGPDLVQVYNDAYIDQGLSRHPEQMGARFAQSWPEIVDALDDQFAAVLRDGTPVLQSEHLLPLWRDGRLVDTYWSYAFTPFVDAEGRVQGILIIPVEATQRVLAGTRNATLQELTHALGSVAAAAQLPEAAMRVLAASTRDATRLWCLRTPRASFVPMPWSGADGQPLAGPFALSVQQWLADHPEDWDRLRAGAPVHGGTWLLVPLPEKAGADVIRFVAFEPDARQPFDAPCQQFLLQIAQRIAQASDRLEAQTARVSSATELDALLMQAPIAAAVLRGPQLVFTFTNHLYCHYVGKQDLVGLAFEQGFPELVGTALPGIMHAAFDTGVPYVSPETPVLLDKHRNGQLEQCYFQFNLQPMRTVEGDVYALMAIVVDLTEHVHTRTELEARTGQLEETVHARTRALETLNSALASANEALRKAVLLGRNVAEMVPGRIAYWDADLRCGFANRRFCDWVGREPDEVLGQRADEVYPPETMVRTREMVAAVLAGEPQRFEARSVRPDGSVHYHQVDYVPEQHAVPGRIGFYLMAFDITPLKEAAFALHEANADLARSRDAAEAASRAKSAFLANMSHEMRTPLNAIMGMTYLLTQGPAQPEQLRQLGKVDAAARHLLGLISDVLDLSKIEAGKLVLERDDFVLAEAIDWALEMVRGAAQAKGLALVHETAGLPRTVRGDALRLSQILINLLSNAVKFTEHGSITLRARVLSTADGRHALHFEVQDTGIGIAPAHLGRLFGSFEQADGSITRRHGGTGLGLALSRQLARAMDGDTGVDSTLGSGSRFWFRIWLGEGQGEGQGSAARPPAQERPASIAELEASLRTLHGGRRVLLAEDNLVNREVGVALLERVGLLVETAVDGAEATTLVRARRYDLVLMDMQMPHVDGLEATRTIRADMNAVPIVAMTANAYVHDRRACLDAGMDDHIAKPVNPALLYAMLLRWLPAPKTPAAMPG